MDTRADGILVTRPADGAVETARRLVDLGWRPVLAPMLRVAPTEAQLPDLATIQAVLVTSARTIQALPEAWRGLPLLAVGDATAERARLAGFAQVESASADATALAALTIRRCDPTKGELLIAGAAGQGQKLADQLTAAGFAVRLHPAYEARPAPDLPDHVQFDLAGNRIFAGLFFSPATARAFVAAFMRACLLEIVLTVEALAISEETAAPLAPLPWRRIRVAKRPNQDELLALLP